MIKYIFKENIDIKEYEEFIKNNNSVSFMQESNWGSVKDNWKHYLTGLYKNEELVAVCLLLIRKITKNINLAYSPRGFVIDFTNKEYLTEFTKGIKKLAKKEKCYMIKIDPYFCNNEISTITIEKNIDKEIPFYFSNNFKEKHNNLLKLGYKHKGYQKSISKTLQPRFNMMIPLINNKFEFLKEEELLNSYKKRIKSYLGNYHKKRGVFFEHTTSTDKLDEFIDILNCTMDRQKIHLRTKEYFEKIMNNYKNRAVLFFGKLDLNIYLDFLKNNNGNSNEIEEITKLINNKQEILTLSTALVIMPDNKENRVSEYLYAGNDLKFNKLQVSFGLVNYICKYSLENKCWYCNLGGIDGNLKDHLATYKSRFNPIIMEFIGEYDLPINKLIYNSTNLFLPILKKAYKLIRK